MNQATGALRGLSAGTLCGAGLYLALSRYAWGLTTKSREDLAKASAMLENPRGKGGPHIRRTVLRDSVREDSLKRRWNNLVGGLIGAVVDTSGPTEQLKIPDALHEVKGQVSDLVKSGFKSS